MQTFEKIKGKPLYEQVRDHLRQQCLNVPPAEALPSLRQLSDALGVNHITISRAMRELEAEGVLRIVPGKGTFVAQVEASEQTIEMITLFSERQYLLDTSRHTFRGMQTGQSEGFTVTGSTLIFPPVPRPDVFVSALKTRGVSAVAVFGFGYLSYPDSFLEAQFIHEIAQHMPLVLIGKEHPLLKLDCIFCDPAPQMQTFLTECYQNGARHFAYLGLEDNQPHLQHRATAFKEFLLDNGLKWHRTAPGTELTSEVALINALLDGKPEVIVVSSSTRAQNLVIQAQVRGLRPGHDFQILCFAGSIEEVEAITSYVNVIVLQEEEVGRCVIHRLQSRLQGTDKPAPITRRIPGNLVRQNKML